MLDKNRRNLNQEKKMHLESIDFLFHLMVQIDVHNSYTNKKPHTDPVVMCRRCCIAIQSHA